MSPEDADRWPVSPSGAPSSQDELLPAGAAGGSRPAVLLAAAGGVAALVIVAIVMVVSSSGGGDDPTESGAGAGGALPRATTTAVPSNAGTVATTTTTTTADPDEPASDHAPAGADLPAVTIPAESTPPTTIPGSEPNSIPVDIFSGEEAPQWGTLVVDLDEGGYLDFPVHLRSDQELQLLSLADDGVATEIEVFAPDGSSEGWWAGGEPGVINGLEWYLPDEPLPATGTYVVRVIHTGGSHEPFALGFFGNP